MTDRSDAGALGGRLPLLHPSTLDATSSALYERVVALVGPEAEEAGYVAVLDDGQLAGPFNAMLYTPALTTGLAEWTGRIGASGIEPEVREAIILTVAHSWRAPYELYAHTAAARAAGLDEKSIAALATGTLPPASPRVRLVQRLTIALIDDHSVPASLYREAIDEFGIAGTLACTHLIAQYQFISSLLVLFEIPVPNERGRPASR